MEPKIEVYKGRIIDIKKYADQTNVLIQGIKLKNQSYYENSNKYAGSNGTYLEFGEYHGMKLDVTFSLYDTDKKFLTIQGKKFRLNKHVTVDIYRPLMDAWGIKRMTQERLESITRFNHKKYPLSFMVGEDSLQMIDDKTAAVKLACVMPFTTGDNKPIWNITTAYIELVE